MTEGIPYFLLGHIAVLVVAIGVLLRTQRPPASAVAWLMSIVFLPYLGALLFLFFGMNRVSRRKRAWWRTRRSKKRRGTGEAPFPSDLGRFSQRLVDLAQRGTGMGATDGNSVLLLPDPQAAFAALEEAIRAARHAIYVQYYIYRPDRVGTRIRDLLIRKAEEGVQVRFMYDGIGSWRLGKKFLRPMTVCGISIMPFLPGRNFRERWSINLRNHRKLVVVDNRVAFTGGLNVGDEYLGRNPAFGYWRDTQLALRGPVVRQLLDVFAEDWHCATDEPTDIDPFKDSGPEPRGDVIAQTISDGPDREIRPLQMTLLSAILEAETSVTISTGYFVPTEALQDALRTAAARGVRVRLLVAGSSTYWYTLWAGRSYYQELLDLGAEVYEYQRGLFHAKVVTVDGCWSLVGTPNFDVRSLELNFEVAVAFCDEKIAADLDRQFAADIEHAMPIEPARWSRRATWRIRGENFCRLFAPLL